MKFESVTTLLSMKYGTSLLDEQDSRQNTRVEEVCCSNFIVSVMSFHVYFDKQIHKKLGKKLSKQKKIYIKLEFC